jgi:lipopolysaccharide export LptBFGC system permease protein LptF
VFGALGTSGGLPTLLAVLAPPLIVLFGAAIFIVSYDTI